MSSEEPALLRVENTKMNRTKEEIEEIVCVETKRPNENAKLIVENSLLPV